MISFPKNNSESGSIFNQQKAKLHLLILVVYVLLSVIVLTHHEMWRDELQAWIVAKDSVSIPQLLENLEYTGHPKLWYISLYFLSQLSSNPVVMQVYHLLIAAAGFGVFLFYSPFNLVIKLLYGFGYYSLFEYGIISRSYSLGLLFLYIACALFPQREKHYTKISIVLAIAAHTNAYALMLSTAFQTILICEALFNNRLSFKRWNLWFGTIIYTIALKIAISEMLPPANASYKGSTFSPDSTPVDTKLFLNHVHQSISLIFKSYLNVPNIYDFNFWNTNIVTDNSFLRSIDLFLNLSASELISISLSIIFFLIFFLSLIRKRIALLLYLFGTTEIFFFSLLVMQGKTRHYGHLFILVLISLWIAHYLPQSKTSNIVKKVNNIAAIAAKKLLLTLLIFQLASGIFVIYMDWMYPFSISKEVANYIRQQHLDKISIAGTPPPILAPLSIWLDKSIYYLNYQEFGTYAMWHRRRPRDIFYDEQYDFVQHLNQKFFQNSEQKELLLILTEPLTITDSNINIIELDHFHGGIVEDEEYYLYLFDKKFDQTVISFVNKSM